ncbi:MAG: DUF1573 domain-containing protein [Candidatus Levybacteria bacterium]|nr:DUF1573 domain-containing protein [Candidatus Levybacteria bacterium]
MNDRKIIILMLLITAVIIVGAIFVLSSSSAPKISASENAQAYTIDPTSFDWGNIEYGGGLVEKTFTIKNNGSDTLNLFNVKTSCHCTKARVEILGKKSPAFGMSGVSSWLGEVPPGKEARLTVIFDPAFHGPQGVGPITRFVSVDTNDKGNSKLTFTLTGTVVK